MISSTAFSQRKRSAEVNTVGAEGKLDFGRQKSASHPRKVMLYHVMAGRQIISTQLLVSIVDRPIHAMKQLFTLMKTSKPDHPSNGTKR